jgi:uncharacterized protein (TIGR00369 family)
MKSLGVEMTTLQAGQCELMVEFSDALAQQHGFFHGGVIASLADVSGGYAAFSLLPPERTNVTVEFKLSLLSPGQGESLLARAAVIKSGRSLTVCRSDVYSVSTSGERTLCATALGTYMAIDRN